MDLPDGSALSKKILARTWYQSLASQTFDRRDVVFMNYGLAGVPRVALTPAEERDRFAVQNYHYLASLAPLAGREVLEVGSGRGGGAAYVMRTFGPASLVGVDLSEAAVRFCRAVHGEVPGLSFEIGDAERLTFEDERFDVVLNLESSHCYASMERFLAGVYRVLKPGGDFLLADLRWSNELELLRGQLSRSGFTVVSEEDIRPQVFAALQDESETKRRLELLPLLDDRLSDRYENFAGAPGSISYRGLASGEACYPRFHLRKPG